MNAATLHRPAILAGALALAAVTATAPFAAAGETDPSGPHNEQVALVNETNAQPRRDQEQDQRHRTGRVVHRRVRRLLHRRGPGAVGRQRHRRRLPALDVVVRDMQSTKPVLVSQSTAGKPGTKNSFFPVISGNGRHVSFQTFSRLGPKDQDKKEDV